MSSELSSSRRSMLAALGIGGLGLALAPQVTGAKSARQDLADHPIVGSWLVQVALPTAPDVTVAVFSQYTSEGLVLSAYPTTEATPRGIVHKSLAVGAWEPLDERTARVTQINSLASPDGVFMGTVTFNVHPQVSEDGQTFLDENPDNLVTIRNANNAIINEIAGGSSQPVRGYRITPGNAAFPDAATPLPSLKAPPAW